MTFKKISVKKTATGYSLNVFVRDGELMKPLYYGICRFFDKVDQTDSSQTKIGEKVDVEEFIDNVKMGRISND